jgi:hypothetical protein
MSIGESVILTWKSNSGSLLLSLKPRIRRVEILPGQPPEDLLRAIAPVDHTIRTVFFHADLTDQTKLPAERTYVVKSLTDRGAMCWNGYLPNLCKMSIQRWNVQLGLPDTRAALKGSPTERLIVKTRLNCFGISERHLTGVEC